MPKHYVFEFGGGLGDVLYQMYDRNVYNVLRDMGPNDHATVWLVCINPFAEELFTKHPRASQITVRSMGYWWPSEDAAKRLEYKMPPPGSNRTLPSANSPIDFFPTEHDNAVLAQLPAKYVVVAAAAGTPDRSIPQATLDRIVEQLLASDPLLSIVLIGRSYERQDRQELRPVVQDPRIIDLIDELTVAGTAALVRDSQGVVTAHSSLSILAWLEHKAVLLVCPQRVLDVHARKGKYDQWLFGAGYSGTVISVFEHFDPNHVNRFLEACHAS